MDERFYTSVSVFSTDLGTVFSAGIGMSAVADTAEVQSHIIDDRSRKGLSAEQKEKRKLAKRIIKAIQPALEDAMRKESELCRRPFEKELRDLDLLLETSISSRRDSMTGSVVEDASDDDADGSKHVTTNGHLIDNTISVTVAQSADPANDGKTLSNGGLNHSLPQADSVPELETMLPLTNGSSTSLKPVQSLQFTPEESHPTGSTHSNAESSPHKLIESHSRTVIPALSSISDSASALSAGGIPWYMEPFDPAGTTVYEERWTGREVARGMSEELSDMDEEELDGLVDGEMDMEMGVVEQEMAGDEAAAGAVERKKAAKVRKRWRGFK